MAQSKDAAPARRPHDLAGTGVAVLFVLFGGVLILQTDGMTPMGSVFPITIAAAMIVFCAALILRNVVLGLRRSAGAEEPDRAAPDSRGSMARRLAFLAVMLAWVVLIPVLGFFAASLLAFFAIMVISIQDPVPTRERVVLVAIGVLVPVAFYLLMSKLLLIPMPHGLLF